MRQLNVFCRLPSYVGQSIARPLRPCLFVKCHLLQPFTIIINTAHRAIASLIKIVQTPVLHGQGGREVWTVAGPAALAGRGLNIITM